MNIKIFQIDMEHDENRIKFCGLEETVKYAGEVDPSIYQKVYDGDVDCSDLEQVYTKFNIDHPDGFTGHSLSLSDVVEKDGQFFFCDHCGFTQIPFDSEQTLQPEEEPDQHMGF